MVVLLASLTLYTYTRAGAWLGANGQVQAATVSTLNFQARLLGSSGAITADTTYSVQFNLYNVATGGVAEWTETQSVVVKSGYLSVGLGSVTAFPTTIDWSQEHWLTMNVNADGEMNPRLKMTAVPYAFKAAQADKLASSNGALSGDNFAQLNPTTIQSITSALAGLRINQTGAGGLLQLQGDGADAFTLSKTGNGVFAGALTAGGLVTAPGLTSTGGLAISSGGAGDLSFDSASNKLIIAGTDTSLVRTGAGAFSIDLADAGTTELTLKNLGVGVANLNLADGAFQTNGVNRITNTGALANITGDNLNGVSFNANTITSGTLGVARGGTGLNTLTTNGIVFGNGVGALQTTSAGTIGQLLVAGTGGVPAFATLSGDATLSGTGVLTIAANGVALGADTTGAYIADITVGGGLTVTGNGAETATAALSLDVVTTGTTAVTSSNSGLEATATGLRLLGGCTNGQLLKWNGTAWACSADNTGLSDATLKTNVVNQTSVLDAIKNVRVVNYNFKCLDPGYAYLRLTCDNQKGILSQELAAIFPDVVKANSDGLFEVNFGALNFYTLKAVTELANVIDSGGNARLGNLSTGNTLRLTSTGELKNITGLSTTGSATFGSITSGLVKADAAGTLANATAGTDYENPLTFINGLTRVGNSIELGGNLSKSTNISLNGNNMTFTGSTGSLTTLFNSGAFEIKTDSSTAFSVKNISGASVFNVDTLTGQVRIGNGNGALLVLDNKTTAGDPAGTNGAQYYNSTSNKFRCFEAGAWKDCLSVSPAGTPSIRSFVDSVVDAVVDNNITDYWDTGTENNNAYPNITTSQPTGKAIMGLVTMETRSTGTADSEVTSRVERSLGVRAVCGAGTVVGGQPGTFSSNTNGRKTSTTQFVDVPDSTLQVFYTLCSDVDTVGTTVQITRIRITLQEVNNTN